ncbi:response regulator transcription factor [Bdellovibrio sp. NC01]|uniref:response regulator transcription factor n=1 Tax=Bdellovibrio sp. NC01 TaxID=2220073 RepID=UPI00115A2FDA|nr:response regulator transcription factor [Bdellovibrio sp. NC01]QDK38950.1 DNA-binding response regulator [Bdellovibrio sp. NC01]
MLNVLLVEDDPQISKSLSMSLKYSDYDVAVAETIGDAWTKMASMTYDILLLDVNLPDGTGIELCEKVRAAGKEVPIIFLSARIDEETVVKGMNIGGDDYLRKPFGTEELKVRMNKVMKRQGPATAKNSLSVGPLTMDFSKRTVLLGGNPLNLGKRQFDILAILAKKAGDVVTRENILLQLDNNVDLFDRTIDSHMSHLRIKLRDAGNAIQIVPVYGVGYRLQWKQN